MAKFKVRDQHVNLGGDAKIAVDGRRTVDGDPEKLTLKALLKSGSDPEKFRIRMGGSVEFSPQDFDKTLAEVNPKGEDFVFEIEPNYVNPAAEDWSNI